MGTKDFSNPMALHGQDFQRSSYSTAPNTDAWNPAMGDWSHARNEMSDNLDLQAQNQIYEILADQHLIDVAAIDIRVCQGIATLCGSVESENLRRQAEEIAWSAYGVKNVHNKIEVSDLNMNGVDALATSSHGSDDVEPVIEQEILVLLSPPITQPDEWPGGA